MVEGALAPPSLLARAEHGYLEFFRAFARVAPLGAIHEEDGLVLVRTGPLLPMLNVAALQRVPADPAAMLDRARTFFAAGQVKGVMIEAIGEAAAALGPAAEAAGGRAEVSSRMLLAPLTGTVPNVPGLTIEPVRDLRSLRVYMDTMTAGFGGGAWALPEILQDDTLLQVPDATHYTGYVDGVPAATAARFTCHRVAVILNVSTVADHRRRGIGAAMTWRAALDGRAEGCIASYLQASDMGLPVYHRMGYQPVRAYRGWLLPT